MPVQPPFYSLRFRATGTGMPIRVSPAVRLAAALVAASFVAAAGPALAVAATSPSAPPPAPRIGRIAPAALSTDDLMARGVAAFRTGDYAAARRDFRLAAQRDIPAAETLLGTMAANGQGGPRNHAVAAAWFLRAARRGYGPAQFALADAFSRGRGVPRDMVRANGLARAAAGQGQPGAAQFAARLGPQRFAQLTPARITASRP